MTLNELKELIADGESDRLEFKETTGRAARPAGRCARF